MVSNFQTHTRAVAGANDHDGEYLCTAWGESVCPVVVITPDRAGVVDFLCSYWFGERPETLHADSREAFDRFMTEFDSDDWDMVDHIEVKFEIGGIRVTKVVDVSKFATRVLARKPLDASVVHEPVGDVPSEVARALTLHPATENLVVRFAGALAEKLALAERKHGYSDGWRDPTATREQREAMIEHVSKGDPIDVAAYCAFLWHHGASTAPPAQPGGREATGAGDEGRPQ